MRKVEEVFTSRRTRTVFTSARGPSDSYVTGQIKPVAHYALARAREARARGPVCPRGNKARMHALRMHEGGGKERGLEGNRAIKNP